MSPAPAWFSQALAQLTVKDRRRPPDTGVAASIDGGEHGASA